MTNNTTKTYIIGKDEALETSIDTMQTKLKNLGFNIEEASWLNPVPNVWSVHIRDVDCSLCFTNGKGATKKAALASALGEYFERLSCNYFFADFYLGQDIANGDFVHYPNEKWFSLTDDDSLPSGMLDQITRDYYDPEQEVKASALVDMQSGNKARGICTLPFERQSDLTTVYIPMNIIGNLYVSNGMSAGTTETEARTQSLSELFERSIKNRIISEAISLPLIPDEVIAQYPSIKASIATLEQEGFPITCYDASLGGKYPVIAVILFNPNDGGSFASFGAHPCFEVALERTVTELLQGRGLKDLDVFSPPTFDNDQVADHHNLETHFIDSSGLISWDMFKDQADYDFVHWDFKGDTKQECNQLMSVFKEIGQEVYIADYEHLGVYGCRIIAPGLSDIYPADDLIWSNNTSFCEMRPTVLSLPAIALTQPETLTELLTRLDQQDDFQPVYELIGLAAPTGDGWKTLRVGELRALIHLALGEHEDALDWVEWTLDYNASTFSVERAHFYRAVKDVLEITLDEGRELSQYQYGLTKMYGEKLLSDAIAHVTQQQACYGLVAGDESMSQFPLHQKLLTSYHKLQRAKEAYNWS